MGYKDDEELTKETGDNNGYVHTGDIGSIDKDGFIKVTGRIKDIIITAVYIILYIFHLLMVYLFIIYLGW